MATGIVRLAPAAPLLAHPPSAPPSLLSLDAGHASLPPGPWRGAGLAVPVFSLRTSSSLGVGDFGDLLPLAELAASCGLRVVQLLPVNDTRCSGTWLDSYPYSAASTKALHPLYLSLPAILASPTPTPLPAQQPLPAHSHHTHHASPPPPHHAAATVASSAHLVSFGHITGDSAKHAHAHSPPPPPPPPHAAASHRLPRAFLESPAGHSLAADVAAARVRLEAACDAQGGVDYEAALAAKLALAHRAFDAADADASCAASLDAFVDEHAEWLKCAYSFATAVCSHTNLSPSFLLNQAVRRVSVPG